MLDKPRHWGDEFMSDPGGKSSPSHGSTNRVPVDRSNESDWQKNAFLRSAMGNVKSHRARVRG